jgi:hypothetical protein
VATAGAEVAVQRDGGVAAEGQRALPATVAKHERHVEIQIQVR